MAAPTPDPSPPPATGPKVPDELIQELDQANAQLHKGKEHLEAELDSYEPDHQRRVDQKRAELLEAERRVEEASDHIHQAIDRIEKPKP